MPKTANIFMDSDVLHYYPVPVLPVETMKALSLKEFRVYNYILSVMSRDHVFSKKLTTTQVQDGAGVYRQDLEGIKVRLKDLKLMSTAKDGKSTVWTLLHPVKGTPVRPLTYLQHPTLTADQIEKYFNKRIGSQISAHNQNGYLIAMCPFCTKEKSLQIALPKDGELGAGLWKCFNCTALPKPDKPTYSHWKSSASRGAGNLVHFEEELLLQKHRSTNLPYSKIHAMAMRSVEQVIQSVEASDEEDQDHYLRDTEDQIKEVFDAEFAKSVGIEMPTLPIRFNGSGEQIRTGPHPDAPFQTSPAMEAEEAPITP